MTDSISTVPRSMRLHPPFTGSDDGLRIHELPLIDSFLEDPGHSANAGSLATIDSRDSGDPGGAFVSNDLASMDEYLDTAPELDADGWAVSSWQTYDWQGLSTLGAFSPVHDRAEADADWIATDWRPANNATRRTPVAQPAYASSHPTADEVAVALDSIARKIRSGELSIDQFRGTPPEVALAAALAAMLELRR